MVSVEQGLDTHNETQPIEAGVSLRNAKTRIPRNVVSSSASYTINLVVTFLIAPLLVHGLGNTAYGVWGLIGQVVEYSFLLDFGLRIAATRYVARHLALDQPDEISRVVTSGLAVSSLSAVLALLAGGVVAWALPRFFPIPPELISHARWSVLVLALGVAVAFPGSLFCGCVAADSRYELLAIRKSAPGVIRLLLLWLFLQRGLGLLTVAVITTLAVCVGYGLDFVFTLRLFPNLRVRRRFFDRPMLKTLISFSFYVFLLSVAWRVIFMTDNVVVGFFLGPVAVTFYSVGMGLASMLRESLGNITMMYAPLAYQMEALEQRDSLRRLFISGSRIALVGALPGVLALVIVGPSFLGLWMGKPFVQPSGPILILLSTEVVFYALWFTASQVLYSIGRHKMNAWLSLCNAVVNLALSVTLVRRLGAVGVAWGTVIPALLVEAVILPVYTASLIGVSPLRFYRVAVLRPLLVAAPYCLWLWICLEQGLIGGYISLASVVIVGLLVYGLLAWNFSLESEERAFARASLGRLNHVLSGIRPAWGSTSGS